MDFALEWTKYITYASLKSSSWDNILPYVLQQCYQSKQYYVQKKKKKPSGSKRPTQPEPEKKKKKKQRKGIKTTTPTM